MKLHAKPTLWLWRWCRKKSHSISPQKIEKIDRDGDTYLWRYIIFKCPLFAIYFHKFDRHDIDYEIHDHPWHFVSIVLWGEYIEQLRTKEILREEGHIAFRRATTAHRVKSIVSQNVETLVIRGPRIREWGFWTTNATKKWGHFIPHDKFEAFKEHEEYLLDENDKLNYKMIDFGFPRRGL